ncbi:hypothetical protein [Pseudonocardia sp. TMWB2A]|uniref:hypothetical protein n=1 Tax=Pseudonocardia sp. TMWB2A TaxID=687430 RepID=UPI00307E94A7
MAETSAEKTRRYRAHKRGDHSLCDPKRRCEAVEAVEQAEAADLPDPVAPGARGPRARALWDDMHAGLGPAHRILLDEACRLVDRLDRIDAVLNDRDWFRLRVSEHDDVARVTVDSALAEARQTVTTLKGVVTELRNAAPKAVTGGPAATTVPEPATSPPADPELDETDDERPPRRRRSQRQGVVHDIAAFAASRTASTAG